MDRLVMGHTVHTVIFDMDGTLSDSAVLTMAALGNIAPDYGLPMPPEDAIRRATGNANPEFYYILFPEFPRDLIYNMGTLVEQEELTILPSVHDRLLFGGCRELLIRLKESNIRLYIASTGDKEHVSSVLRETGIMYLFDRISCGCPDKTEMLREMTKEGDKNGYIMVGDMKKDYEAARANGIISVGACYGYCRRELSGFDFYIDTPLELLQVLHIEEETF